MSSRERWESGYQKETGKGATNGSINGFELTKSSLSSDLSSK
jgi:hypothetical protein